MCDDRNDDEPNIAFVIVVAFVLIAIIVSCDSRDVSAQGQPPPPFLLNLPDDTQQETCTARYDAEAKVFDFGPCVDVFKDGFE